MPASNAGSKIERRVERVNGNRGRFVGYIVEPKPDAKPKGPRRLAVDLVSRPVDLRDKPVERAVRASAAVDDAYSVPAANVARVRKRAVRIRDNLRTVEVVPKHSRFNR